MAKLSLNVRKCDQNRDGSFTIKVAISSRQKMSFISTNYTIDSFSQWKNGKVVRRPDADSINRRLMSILFSYQGILEANPAAASWESKDIRDYILRVSRNTGFMRDFGKLYIERLVKNGQSSYARNMGYTLKYLLEGLGQDLTLNEMSLSKIRDWERFLFNRGDSATTVNIRMTHLKALINAAIADCVVTYQVNPFQGYRMPCKVIRDLCISPGELRRIGSAVFEGVSARRLSVARDLFMLSFYCGGMNLTDIVDADWSGESVRFVRKKTARKTSGQAMVELTIQPEAREIVERYITADGRLDFGYNYSDYGQFRSFVTKSLNRIGEGLGFEKKLMFYSARKTFCQIGYENGIPLYILEFAIGHTVKDAANRPIFNYIKMMKAHADQAIRIVIDACSKDAGSVDAVG